jgi:hypothetical protein
MTIDHIEEAVTDILQNLKAIKGDNYACACATGMRCLAALSILDRSNTPETDEAASILCAVAMTGLVRTFGISREDLLRESTNLLAAAHRAMEFPE